MSSPQYIRTNIVGNFAGEDINHPDFLVPPNVAKDARNVDYYRGTILKRSGFKRLDDRMLTHGGLRLRKNTSGTTAGNIVWNPSSAWAIAFAIQLDVSNTDDGSVVAQEGTPTTDGWNIAYDKTNHRFVAQIESSGGTKTLSQATDSYPAPGKCVMLMLIYYEAEDGTKYYRFYQDATLVEDSDATDTYVSASPIVFNVISSSTCWMWISELRIWEFENADDAAYTGVLAHWVTDYGYKRELTDSEVASGKLIKLYRFEVDNLITGATSGFTPTKGTGNFRVSIPALGLGDYRYDTAPARNLICPQYDNDFPRMTALDLFSTIDGDLWVRLGHELTVHSDHQAYGIMTYATAPAEIFTYGSGMPLYEAWSICRYRTALVAVHPYVGCFFLKYLTFTQLCLPAPSVSGVTADDSGGGTGPTDLGVYSFKFFYRNSNGEVTGLPSATPVTCDNTAWGGTAIELNGIASMFTLRRYLEGSNYVDIFRTKAGGSTYYLVESVLLTASPADPYTSAQINVDDANIDESQSEGLLRYDMADRFFYRARAVVEHRGYLMLIAPYATSGYSAPDLRDAWQSAIAWSEPLAINLFENSNYREVLPDVNDFCVGAISVLGGLLIAKRYSLVAMFGDAPDTWTFRLLSKAHGCISHRSIAASDSAVFLLSDNGIIRIPIPLGSGFSENISIDRFKPLTDDIDVTKLGRACGVYWRDKAQYWVTFDTVSNGRVTLIWNEATKALARYDLDIEAYALVHPNDPTVAEKILVGSYRGYIVQLDTAASDGADVEANQETLDGTVTAADAYTVTDSGQSWTTAGHYGTTTADSPYAILAGLKVVLTHANGTEETREIYFNTATRFWVSEAWDTTPSVGDTFVIAGINWYWQSARIAPHGDPGEQGHTLRMTLWQRPQDVAQNFQYGLTLDDVAVTPTHPNLTNDTRKVDRKVGIRAEEFQVKFHNAEPELPVEIEAFRFDVEQAQPRP